jgi:hypothetical protein
MRFYGDICKIDEEQRMVWGYASTEAVDNSGEVIKKDAIEQALEDYMQFANIREMHQLSAVGVAKEAQVDDRGLYLGAKVVDDNAWTKVKEGVYKGFSVGGKVQGRDSKNKKVITKLSLSEISLVDRPCNPEAVFDVFKAEGSDMDQNQEAAATSPELAMPPAGDPAVETVETTKADVAQEASQEAVEAVAEVSAPDGAETEKAATVDPEPVAEAPVEEVAKVEEPETVKVDEAEVTKTEAETPTETVVQKTAAEKAADAVTALEALAKTDESDDAQKSMHSVRTFASVLSGIASLMSDSEYKTKSEGDNSPVPAALRDWLSTGVSIFKGMAVEEVSELVAAYSAKADATGDLSKTDDNAGAEADTAKAAGADEALAKAQADNEALKADLAKRDEAFEAIADRITKANEDITRKLAAKLDETTKVLEDTQDRLKKVEESPLPPKTTVLPVGLTAVSKAEDSAGLGATPPTQTLSPEAVKAALDAMSEEDRALVVMKAALSRPQFIGR